jgi:AcrR family transcriptional regulator
MRRAYHHGDLRTALLGATVAIVRQHGPSALTLRDVAKRAGVSEAAPYHHFESKAHLLLEAAAQGYTALGARLAATSASGPASARARLPALGAAYVRFALDEPGYFRLMFGAHIDELVASPNRHPGVAAAKRAGRATANLLRAGVADFIAETTAPIGARELERLVWAQIHGLAWLALEKELHPPPMLDEIVELAARGVALVLDGAQQRQPPLAQPRTRRPRGVE